MRSLSKDKVDALYDALDAGMTQREVAKRLGCSVSTVNDWKKRREEGKDDAANDAPVDPNEVLDWNNLIDRCTVAQRLCVVTPDVDSRMELLAAALWPKEEDSDAGAGMIWIRQRNTNGKMVNRYIYVDAYKEKDNGSDEV